MTIPLDKPRLLVLASTYPRWAEDVEPGFVHELTRRLTDSFEVSVITPHAPGALSEQMLDGVHIQRYRYAPLRWETLVHGGGIVTNLKRSPWKLALVPGFIAMQWWAVRRALKRAPVAVVHAHWLLPQGLVVRALGERAPAYVVTSHGADLFALRGEWFARLRRAVVARAAAVTVVSAAMREQVLHETPTAAVEVLPMGVDTVQRFTPDSTQPREPAELLFVGRLVEKKGLRHLLDALPAVLVRHPATRLTIAGFGPEQASLQQQVQRLGLQAHVNFLGAVAQSQLPALYRRASLFVAPFVKAQGGDQEGLGLVVAEAMACGCPVLVGDVPAVHDLVSGETGVIVAAVDTAGLAAAIDAVLIDPAGAAARAERARARVLAHFGWDAVAANYRAVLLAAASTLPRK
jgi:glycosyltransferase involved in cell wall biosynthesis